MPGPTHQKSLLWSLEDTCILPTKLIQNAQSNLLCSMSQERRIVRVNKRSFIAGHGSIVRVVGGHAVIGAVCRPARPQSTGLGPTAEVGGTDRWAWQQNNREGPRPNLPARRTTLKFASIKCQLCDTDCTDGGRPTNASLTLEGQAYVKDTTIMENNGKLQRKTSGVQAET